MAAALIRNGKSRLALLWYDSATRIAMISDIDGDGTVGINDFLDLLAAWGPNPCHPVDLDGDGIVGICRQ